MSVCVYVCLYECMSVYEHMFRVLYIKKQVYIEKKTSLYLLYDDYVLSIADGTSVSTFLCTPGA